MRFGGRHEDIREAESAIRDILFLYRELTEYHGIVGDHDTGTFKPWRFLNCSLSGGYGGPETESLLHEGAAVALLSTVIDWWTQGGSSNLDTYRAAVAQGRFDHLPTARKAMVAGLESEQAMSSHLDAVYEEYVLAYFAALSRARREQ